MTRTVIQPASVKDPRPRYSQAIRTEGGSLLFIAGQTAVDKNGAVVGKGSIERQTEQVFENLGAVLEAAGASFENLVMTTTYLTAISHRDAFSRIRARYYGQHHQPASTLVIVTSLGHEDLLVEVDGIAVL